MNKSDKILSLLGIILAELGFLLFYLTPSSLQNQKNLNIPTITISENPIEFVKQPEINPTDSFNKPTTKNPPIKSNPALSSLSKYDREIFERVNLKRLSVGFPAYKINAKLNEVAKARALDLYNKNYFSHTSPDGRVVNDFAREARYKYSEVGENLGRDFNNVDGLMTAWLESPTHWNNILDEKYTETGVYTYQNISVQVFGLPQ